MMSQSKLEVTASDFLELFLRTQVSSTFNSHFRFNSGTFLYSGLKVVDPLFIDSSRGYNISMVVFENCDFDQLQVNGISIEGFINFIGCTFNADASFQNKTLKNCFFKECTFLDSLELINIVKASAFNFAKITCKKLLIVGVLKSTVITIHENCQIEQLTISTSEPLIRLAIENSSIDLMESDAKSDLTYLNHLTIKNGKLRSSSDTIAITNITVEENLNLDEGKVDKIDIIDLKGNGTLHIYNKDISKINLSNASISNIVFGNFELQGEYLFSNCIFTSLVFDRTHIESKNVKFNLVRLRNRGKLVFHNCDLGKAHFTQCTFSSATVVFHNSKIQEIFLIATDFPKEISSSTDHRLNFAIAQLFYGQLQTAYIKQGDNIRANDFQSSEIEAYYRSLKWGLKRTFTPFRNLDVKFRSRKLRDYEINIELLNVTKLSLWFNYVSNGFGRKWFNAALFTFAFGLLFFLFVVWSTEEYELGISSLHGWPEIFLRFMNPLRQFKLEEMFENKVLTFGALSSMWDFLGRIFVAYGYYQTIQAFRRYGKK